MTDAQLLRRRGQGTATLLVDSSWDANGTLVAPNDYLTRCADRVLGRHAWDFARPKAALRRKHGARSREDRHHKGCG